MHTMEEVASSMQLTAVPGQVALEFGMAAAAVTVPALGHGLRAAGATEIVAEGVEGSLMLAAQTLLGSMDFPGTGVEVTAIRRTGEREVNPSRS